MDLFSRLVGRHRQDHMAQRQSDEVALLDARRAVQAGDLDVGQRQELPLRRVEVVGEAAPIAVGGQQHVAGDAVAVGLDDDALGALLHARARYRPPWPWWHALDRCPGDCRAAGTTCAAPRTANRPRTAALCAVSCCPRSVSTCSSPPRATPPAGATPTAPA